VNELFVKIHIWEQDEEDDGLYKFTVPENVSLNEVEQALADARERHSTNDHDCIEDTIDAVLGDAAEILGGTCESVEILCVTVRYDDDDEGD
jgi:hypothetical protein